MHAFAKSSLLVLALGFGVATYAQEPQTTTPPAAPPVHQANPAHEAKHLSKELGLSADQQAQLGPILADRQQKLTALAANTSLDQKSMRQQRHAIMMDSNQKINAVLTPAQQQQFATLKAERKHGKGAEQPATPPTAS